MNATQTRYDVAIVGGSVMGASVACFLKWMDPACSVVMIEPDPTFEWASTPRASGGARRLFSCPENIAMSNFSIDFIGNFENTMAIDGEPAHVGWREQGYLFIVPPRAMSIIEENAQVQRSLGVEVELFDRGGLKRRFPSMHVDDLGGGVLSPRDGWLDPNGFMQGFRRKARALGVQEIRERVVGFERSGHAVTQARLASGATVQASAFVNATGAWAGEVSAMAGMPLPVSPMRRFEHYFTGFHQIEALPYVKDLSRLAFRPEGQGYSGGLVASNEPRGFNFDVDHDYFESVVWPALAHRFPGGFEGAKCHRTWAGLYEQCELDGNPIIGNWQGTLDNFYVVSGFSGHGMMHAPAAGRGIAELILHGEFRTIDLSRLGYERVERNEPYRERGIL